MSKTMRIIHAIGILITFVAVILFCLILWLPGGSGLCEVLRTTSPLFALVSLVAVASLAFCLFALVDAAVRRARSFAQLSSGESGSISIEKSALVSIVRRSLERVSDAQIQHVDVDVLQRRGSAVLYVTVKATPLNFVSLMKLAEQIQDVAKKTLESFTEREVRYVAVNFVESRKSLDLDKAEVDDAGAAVAGKPAPAEAMVADKLHEPKKDALDEGVFDQPSQDPADKGQQQEEEAQQSHDDSGNSYETVMEQPPSFWSQVKSRFSRSKGKAADAGEPSEGDGARTDADKAAVDGSEENAGENAGGNAGDQEAPAGDAQVDEEDAAESASEAKASDEGSADVAEQQQEASAVAEAAESAEPDAEQKEASRDAAGPEEKATEAVKPNAEAAPAGESSDETSESAEPKA